MREESWGLGRPLFVRLAALGYHPNLLRLQYRHAPGERGGGGDLSSIWYFIFSRPVISSMLTLAKVDELGRGMITESVMRFCGRCHPAISEGPNRSFYGGRLLDGVSEEDRPPLLPGLPTLLCLDVRGSEAFDPTSHSTANHAEATAVARVLTQLLQAGVQPRQCGVICFYRAQVPGSNPAGDKEFC